MEDTLVNLSKEIDEKRYGKYRGFVTSNKDPDKRGRLRLHIPSVLGDQESDWALPCLPFGGGEGYGFFAVPEEGAQVWVEFEEGDVHRPIWTGTFWLQQSDVPEDASSKSVPSTRLLQTPSGHILQFDDEEGEEEFRLYHPADAEIIINKHGSIALTDTNGATLKIDADAVEIVLEDANGNTMIMNDSGITVEDLHGNRIEMNGSGITVDSEQQILVRGSQVHLGGLGGEPVIKGQSFLSLFMTHIHTVAPLVGGPTSPPLPQGEMSTLSTKVMST